jgi:hypothetical protein
VQTALSAEAGNKMSVDSDGLASARQTARQKFLDKTQAALEKLSRNGWSYGGPSLLTLADQLDAMVDFAAEIF